MKKFLILSLVALAGVFSMNAAQGEKAFGAQFSYASKHSMVGLGLNFQYEFVNNFRIIYTAKFYDKEQMLYLVYDFSKVKKQLFLRAVYHYEYMEGKKRNILFLASRKMGKCLRKE